MSRSKFYDIVQQFTEKNFIPRVVVLYHGGEPLLNKDLELFIAALKNIGVSKTVITTNASMLNETRARGLILAGLDEMKVSFDGMSPEENNTIRDKGDFERDSNNVLSLLRLKKKLGLSNPRVKISNVQVLNRTELDVYLNRGKRGDLVIPEYLEQKFMPFWDEIDKQAYPAMVWPDLSNKTAFDTVSLPSLSPTYCPNLFETFSIQSNGSVVACCYDLPGDRVFGNVFEANVFDIWKSKDFVDFRRNFTQKIYEPLCSNCVRVNPKYQIKSDSPES
jgi:MoaA/NifB/PqqE/SkfB family radical SAM enzyme